MTQIQASEKTYIEELATNQLRNLMVICERLFLEFNEESQADEKEKKIANKLQDEPELLGIMLQKEAVECLFHLWDTEESNIMKESYLRELQQLRYLGFISMDEETLFVNMEAKDIFFFSMKGHRMKSDIEKYTQWEKVIFGMLFSYGILDIYYCYQIFKKIMNLDITYDQMEEFFMIRIIFWNSGLMLRNQTDMRLFFASREVTDRNEIFDQWNQRPELKFREYTKDEYINLAMGNGIISWDGIPEFFSFVLDEIEDDRYKAMLIMKSIVLMVQNGSAYPDIVLQVISLLDEESREKKQIISDFVERIYYSIPVYGQKGYSRNELKDKHDRIFQVIDGGKC